MDSAYVILGPTISDRCWPCVCVARL